MTEASTKQVLMQRIFVKDASLEVPHAPQIYTRAWKPAVDVQVQTSVSQAGENYQVLLSVSVTAKLEEDLAFLVEIQQAGIFLLKNITEVSERNALLGAYCPNMLFPYAREAVSDMIGKAGFPPILLQPINFEAVYQQSLQQQRAREVEAGPPPGTRPQ